jgi:hypothetical protein
MVIALRSGLKLLTASFSEIGVAPVTSALS